MVFYASALLAFFLGLAPLLITGLPIREFSHGSPLAAHSTNQMVGSSSTKDTVTTIPTTSLAGPFLLTCQKNTKGATFWLKPIKETNIDRGIFSSEGGQAWAALHHHHHPSTNSDITIRVNWEGSHCTVTLIPEDADIDQSLLATLSRILVQWSIASRQQVSEHLTFHFPREESLCRIPWSDLEMSSSKLYDTQGEMVEMVDRVGTVLGRVPRKLVHQHNLLHRGIGLFVTKDHPMEGKRPDLYTHRRTNTKRIFPSLYDMFVGGVSLAGEDAVVTARREVEEELGLACHDHLIEKRLLQCVVCTSYNRCIVDLFVYVMNTDDETVKWQEEEVAWGSFVPYKVIEAAADRSIQRLADKGEWPGRNPPIQSSRRGNLDQEDEMKFEGASDWTLWDFVPDGLLVWEAWLRHIQNQEA